MSTFLYKCDTKECKNHPEFEVVHSIHTVVEKCPECDQAVVKLINFGGGVKVELYGDDFVAKIKSDAKEIKQQAHRNENLMANLVGSKFDKIVK